MITLKEVKETVKRLGEMSGDPEAAHSREDDLYEEVLKAIADGSPEAVELAKAALKSKKWSFPRWCA